MAAKMFLIFNHRITAFQEADARRQLAVEQIVELPPGLKDLWRHIPPELFEIRGFLSPIMNWLDEQATPGDHVLIQGDFGACFLMVNLALQKGLVPVYSTTLREAVEEHRADGSVELTHRFKHRMFRRYMKP